MNQYKVENVLWFVNSGKLWQREIVVSLKGGFLETIANFGIVIWLKISKNLNQYYVKSALLLVKLEPYSVLGTYKITGV